MTINAETAEIAEKNFLVIIRSVRRSGYNRTLLLLPQRRIADGLERLLVIPLGQEQLAGGAARAARRPRQGLPIGRRHRQAVEAVGIGHTYRLFRSRRVDD